MNTPSEEFSGQRILRRRIFRPNKKITVAKNSPAKNHPAKNFPSEELSGEESCGRKFSASGEFFFERRILRRRIIRAKNSPSEELSGEEFS
jgi:hypothetical protein